MRCCWVSPPWQTAVTTSIGAPSCSKKGKGHHRLSLNTTGRSVHGCTQSSQVCLCHSPGHSCSSFSSLHPRWVKRWGRRGISSRTGALGWPGTAPGMILQTLPEKETIPGRSEPSAHLDFWLTVTSDTFKNISCRVKKSKFQKNPIHCLSEEKAWSSCSSPGLCAWKTLPEWTLGRFQETFSGTGSAVCLDASPVGNAKSRAGLDGPSLGALEVLLIPTAQPRPLWAPQFQSPNLNSKPRAVKPSQPDLLCIFFSSPLPRSWLRWFPWMIPDLLSPMEKPQPHLPIPFGKLRNVGSSGISSVPPNKTFPLFPYTALHHHKALGFPA